MSYQHVIISGNVIDGVTLVGPFDDPNTAHDYAQGECNDEWSVGPIYTPVDVAPSAECNDLHEQYNNLKEHYDVLSRKNDELDDTRQSLLISERRRWDEIQELRAERDELVNQCATLTEERDSLRTQTNTLQGICERKNATIRTVCEERDELRSKLIHVEGQYHECQDRHSELEAALEALRASTIEADLITENETLKDQYDAMVSALQERSAECDELSTERDNLRNLYENVVEHRDSLFDALSDQTDKNYQLRTERDGLKREVILYQSVASPNYFEVVRERDAARAEREELKAKYEDLKSRCTQSFFEGLVAERDAVRAENRELSIIVTNQQRACIDLHAEIEELSAKCKNLDSECDRLLVDHDELREDNETLRNDLEERDTYVTWLRGRIKSLVARRDS